MRDVDKSTGVKFYVHCTLQCVLKNKKITSLIKNNSSKIPLKNKITTINMNQR